MCVCVRACVHVIHHGLKNHALDSRSLAIPFPERAQSSPIGKVETSLSLSHTHIPLLEGDSNRSLLWENP